MKNQTAPAVLQQASATGIPASVPLSSSSSPSFFPSEILNLKSASPSSSPPMPSPSSPLPSSSDLCDSATGQSSPLRTKTQSPDLAAALDYIAQNPASEVLSQFQSHFSAQSFDPTNEQDLKRLDLFLTIYAKLQNSAAFERVSTALDQVGQSPKREKLLKELVKIMSVQDRSIARNLRQQESIAKEQRRLEREAKREQSQAAKHAREDRAFNQREDHLTRKEKIAQSKLDAALHTRANQLRDQLNNPDSHRQSSKAKSQGANLPPQNAESQAATPSSPSVPSAP